MPWTSADAKKHTDLANTAAKQKRWAETANGVLADCLAGGGKQEECEAKAIRIANASLKEASMLDFDEMLKLYEAATFKAQLQGFMKMAAQMAGNKSVPKPIRARIAKLQKDLRQRWSDLVGDDVSDGDGETKTSEAEKKTEDGQQFPASDYAYVPDPDKPSTWKLRLTKTPGGTPDAGIVGAAIAALGKGFRGEKVQIPSGDLPKVKAKVRAAWSKANPDKDASDMPPVIKESEEIEILADIVPLVETGFDEDGSIPLRIIQPGWGSSGFYPEETLQASAQVFRAGTKMYWDHATDEEEEQRPERSLRDLAGVLVTDAAWVDHPLHGPGLYGKAKVFSEFRKSVEDLAPHIGVSICATGMASHGEAEGREGPIIEQITAAKSVDFVTTPGAGGQVVSLFEAARDASPNNAQGGVTMTEEEIKKLQQEKGELETALAESRLEIAKQSAQTITVEEIGKAGGLPDPAQKRITTVLAAISPGLTESGELDEAAWRKIVTDAIASEQAYLKELQVEEKTVKGMGPAGDGDSTVLQEAFKNMYLAQGIGAEEAERLASVAAQ